MPSPPTASDCANSKTLTFSRPPLEVKAPLEPPTKLIIFDTTLRDGEQSPGVTLSADDKVEIARHLSRLGVTVCESGFPAASRGDFEAVRRIAREVGPLVENRASGSPMVICGLARATTADIDCAYEAIREAPLHRIHTFLATSDIHLQWKLRISREQCIERAVAAVRHARSLCQDVEFSPEDAGRSDWEFLCKVLARVIEAGATTLNIPDTVGYNTPDQYAGLLAYLRANTEGAERVIWSTHCHNDLGLATANTLAAVQFGGARQVEVTINGIGERAGNTSLEEIVMAVQTHASVFPVYTEICTPLLFRTSQLVARMTGMRVQPNKAIVGENAFAHQSGIHQDGMLKHQETYEIIKPETVGQPSTTYVLGKLSGRNGLRKRLEDLGFEDVVRDGERFELVFARFKSLADTKKEVTDGDLVALVCDAAGQSTAIAYTLQHMQVVTTGRKERETTNVAPVATATISILDHTHQTVAVERMDAAIGNGPVDAIFRCIRRLLLEDAGSNAGGSSAETTVKSSISLADYEVKSVTSGGDAMGKVTVKLAAQDLDANGEPQSKRLKFYLGHAVHCDVLTASALACIDAMNKLRVAAVGIVE